MATEYLIEGAKTFAAAAWSGSGIADSNDFVVEYPFGPVTAGLDQSSLTTGIESLSFVGQANGRVGSGGGALLIDVDNSADAYVRVRPDGGIVELYISAAGGSGVINNLDIGRGAKVVLVGGTVGTVTIDGGDLYVSEAAVVTNIYQYGGSVEMEYNSTESTIGVFNGGQTTLRRGVNAMSIGEKGNVVFDPNSAVAYTGNSLLLHGGRIDWRDGAIPTVTAHRGIIDWRGARRPFTPGSSAFTLGGATIYSSALVSETNILRVGAYAGENPIPLG